MKPKFSGPAWRRIRHFTPRKSSIRIAAALLMALWCVLCASATEPQRIISTAPSITETLFALGLGPHVVGVSRYCEYPPEVKKLPRVGAYMDPDPEIIARLHPDMVLVHKLPNQLEDRLAALHIRYAVVYHGGPENPFDEIREVGKATGTEDRANALISKMQQRLSQIHEQATRYKSPSILIVIGRTPGTLSNLIVVGRDEYLDSLVTAAGGRNVIAGTTAAAYPHISIETVLRENPDVILDLGDMGQSEEDGTKVSAANLALWRTVPGLRAAQQGHVFSSSSKAFVTPGPRATDAAAMLFAMLYGRPPQ
ncbi:ABC transporter substrate-binding protein [Silvibacterium acidisoli]|uniref:ABC transporter substrate-binding protein n=1 Tax=Acidobacteriaceae bacterium ZG23-2 TaxID=2883246 RepID=UPI00406C45A1